MFDLSAVQAALREFACDGWLLGDFRGNNVLARRVLGLAEGTFTSRRFFYCVPAAGPPRKLVHRIEAAVLDHLPGERSVYLTWQELEAGIRQLVAGLASVAMEYSPRNANPYIARVDAGTVELVRSCGVDVVPSGDLIQLFEATWDDEQWQLHQQAAVHTNAAFARAWSFIAQQVGSHGATDELAVGRQILDHFAEHGLVTDHPPIVAVGPHSGLPHYETGTGSETAIRGGDFVLIDLWAKVDHPQGVYSDLTRVGYVGQTVPEKYQHIFHIVAAARDAGIACVKEAFASGGVLRGWQVDDAVRAVIDRAGYGPSFTHRTGHSLGRETHGNGANMDNLETHDDRRVLPRTCFSIEPGIYLPDFGVRSEVNVFVDAGGAVHVTGGEVQSAVQAILQ